MGEVVEVPNWLKKLPLAPVYYPTDTEFADPIAYISKIEKEASVYGICKVIPPLPKPSKKYVFNNVNKSLLKSPELGTTSNNGEKESRAVFTTRHQELGCSMKKMKGQQSVVHHKQVWQSGEVYTLEQFEAKAKFFAKTHLGVVKEVSPLVVEALFWKVALEKPIYIEYANDVPGSGFGEPEEVCQYFHRRRRRRTEFNQNLHEGPNDEKHGTDDLWELYSNPNKDSSVKYDSDFSSGTSRGPRSSPGISEEGSRFRRQKSSNAGNESEGTAGWKLSNSPWNLQVIARSMGSLTRYMLDDIPGVTSPMIYIGMLFSWFAWHVEDHELHSLNFLHTGCQKTWYAVPGDYACSFEEVIRSKGYGGNLDCLAALTLLGEKTNLLSPDVVTASGIPCCRLVQNPGEFVVTFPRAYHVGFSHGFNCGEAANFGTPQWLKVAKEAAVRRAAMNYLPMLSHQQLLYMLTMSFISRVPRALILGARTSRLKDRQKEERELLVKKAFIDDMLNEKNLVLILLGKESTSYAVLWDPEKLPSPESVPDKISTVSTMSIWRKTPRGDDNCCSNQVDSTRLSMEKLEDFSVDDDDLPYGLQVDSGTLACVACGVLGFPFMSIVQPSWRAYEELFTTDCQLSQGNKISRSMKSHAPSDLHDAASKSASDSHDCDENQKVSSNDKRRVTLTENCLENRSTEMIDPSPLKETSLLCYPSPQKSNPSMVHSIDLHPSPPVSNLSQISKDKPLHSTSNAHQKWNTLTEFLRPRVFCLEHALEIEELLHPRGGANVLIICHSAYSKIKAHALAVAEEVGVPFDCDEIPLHCASREDLNLISISIDDDEHEECGEDWTSRLGLNLRYCVQLKKLSPFKQDQHALALGGLFTSMFGGLDCLDLKWNSRRSRTPYKAAGTRKIKTCGHIEKSHPLVEEAERSNAPRVNKIVQYSRRRFREKVSPLQACSKTRGFYEKQQSRDVFANNEDVGNNVSRDTPCAIGTNGRADFVELNKDSVVNSGMQPKENTSKEKREMNEISDSARYTAKNTGREVSELEESLNVENSDVKHIDCSIGQTNGIRETSDLAKCAGVRSVENLWIENDVQNNGETLNSEVSDHENSAVMFSIKSTSGSVKLAGSSTADRVLHEPLTVGNSEVQQDGCTIGDSKEISKVSDPSVSPGVLAVERLWMQYEVHTNKETLEKCEVSHHANPEFMLSMKNKNGYVPLVGSSTVYRSEMQHNLLATEARETREVSDHVRSTGSLAIPCSGVGTLEAPLKDQSTDKANKEDEADNLSSKMQVILVEQESMTDPARSQSSQPIVTSSSGEACNDVILDIPEMQLVSLSTNATCEAKVSDFANSVTEPSLSDSMVGCSEEQELQVVEETYREGNCSAKETMELEDSHLTVLDSHSSKREKNKRKREVDRIKEDESSCNRFFKSPCEGLRPRTSRTATSVTGSGDKTKVETAKEKTKQPSASAAGKEKKLKMREVHRCDIENCEMSFKTRGLLTMHKRSKCTHKGCGKQFRSHKYAVLHQRVHVDERPLKCPWKGCTMSFKWAWARTEHLRVHTGERPYQCKIEGCDLTFRFVSDYSRHRRKTGHYVDSPS